MMRFLTLDHKKTIFGLFLIGSLQAVAFPSDAMESSSSPSAKTEEECLKLHPQITSPVEMASCTEDIEGSRKDVSASYRTLENALEEHLAKQTEDGKERLQLLKSSQQSWVSYRDAQCAYESYGHMGTSGSSLKISCEAKKNRARAKELESAIQIELNN